MSFITEKLDQSEEFDVIGQQVSYCRRPRATCHIALDDIMPSGPAGLGHYIAPVQYGMLHSCWAITNIHAYRLRRVYMAVNKPTDHAGVARGEV